MKCLVPLFIFIGAPFVIFSQTKKLVVSEHRMKVGKAANYYLRKKINPLPEFSIQYTSLFAGLEGYTKKDSLRAYKLINRLYQVNNILFYRLMRIRLEWEFKQHLDKSPLDSVTHLLKNNIDSSMYYYMLGLYFSDSMNNYWARRLGYVKVNSEGNEIVDWRKMKKFKWNSVKEVVSMHENVEKILQIDRYRDSSIFYYKKATDNDPAEFHFLKEFLLFTYNRGENENIDIQQIISSKLKNYTENEKEWLKQFLDNL